MRCSEDSVPEMHAVSGVDVPAFIAETQLAIVDAGMKKTPVCDSQR